MKVRLKTAGAALLMLFIPSSLLADTYRFIARDDDDAAVFINETSVNRVAEHVTVWMLALTGKYLKGDTPPAAYYLLQNSFDCRAQRVRPTAMSIFDAQGVRVHSDEKGAEEGVVEPGTIDQDVYKLVCKGIAPANKTFEAMSPHILAREFRRDLLAISSRRK